MASFRFLIAFANQHGLLIHHMDVETAFLNGELDKEIFMEIPQGVNYNKNVYCCKLKRALYGLKQAARCWFIKFEKVLLKLGFQTSPVDKCMYILNKGNVNDNIYVILYVDDLVIVTGKTNTMDNFKRHLMNEFSMKDLDCVKLFLGIRVERKENKISLSQSAYIKSVLEKFSMQDCKPVESPLPTKIDYDALNSDEKYDAPCRQLIGCLMYLMVCTCLDLSNALSIVSRYTNKNDLELWKSLKRILIYLKGTFDLKLTYTQGDYDGILKGYVDLDWAGDTNERAQRVIYSSYAITAQLLGIRKGKEQLPLLPQKQKIWPFMRL